MQRFLFILFLFANITVSAQEVNQTIRGQVLDAITNRPLEGATLVLSPDEFGQISDSSGHFRFEKLPPARYELTVNYLGYQSIIIPEILLSSSKETVLDIYLEATSASLAAVTVRAPRATTFGNTPHVRTLSIEETLRFPATYSDPARLAATLPGVVITNDQANHLSIRGNSPNGMGWRLEGLEIVNPNHTSNAGTLSDQASANGGGVNALNAQVLDNSRLHTGVFPVQFGNATAGILDMYLRPGNNEQHEFSAQASFIGFDVSAEGPLSRKKGSSFLVNYRYSFTGLLSDLGVPLGDEDIRFQDLSFHFVFPNKTGGKFTLFGFGGNSSNDFTGPKKVEEFETDKDVYENIDFESKLGVAGFTFQQTLGKRGHLHLATALSGTESNRNSFWRGQLIDPIFSNRYQRNQLEQNKLATTAFYRYKINPTGSIEAGIAATRHQNIINSPLKKYGFRGWINEPFLNWKQQWKAFQWQAGIRLSIQEETFQSKALMLWEPRLQVSWQQETIGQISLSYGLHNQQQAAELITANKEISPTRAHHFVAGWQKNVVPNTVVNLQAYYQYLFDVPVIWSTKYWSFSTVNYINENSLIHLAEKNVARNYGLEVQVQRFVGQGYSFSFSGALYSTQHKVFDDTWNRGRFDGRFASNLIIGKEWAGVGPQKQARLLGMNIAFRLAGNQREQEIDISGSRAYQTTVFTPDHAFTTAPFDKTLKNYFRTDFRIYYQKNHKKWSSMLSFDLQNVTNQQNEGFHYFDLFLDRIETQYQLELLPILTYRLRF